MPSKQDWVKRLQMDRFAKMHGVTKLAPGAAVGSDEPSSPKRSSRPEGTVWAKAVPAPKVGGPELKVWAKRRRKRR